MVGGNGGHGFMPDYLPAGYFQVFNTPDGPRDFYLAIQSVVSPGYDLRSYLTAC